MDDLLKNLSHLMRGAALMFYILMCARTFSYRKENNFKKILFWSMVFMCVLVAKDMLFLSDYMWSSSYFCNVSMLADLLYVPLMALFFFEAVSPGWINTLRTAGVFLPVVTAFLLYIVYPDDRIVRITMLYIILFGVTVIAVILMAMSRRDNRIKNYFSDISDISVTWVWKALCTLLVSLVAWTVLMWKSSYLGDAVYFLVSICCWSYIYFLAIKHKVVEIPVMAEAAGKDGGRQALSCSEEKICPDKMTERQDGNTESPDSCSRLQERLSECMEKEEIFLNPRLTLSDLAAAVGTNRTYLSDFLNGTLHTTFYEYVNGYRARKAAALIRSHPDKTFTEIAELSGYNSISTFYRSFARTAGISPARFKDREKLS